MPGPEPGTVWIEEGEGRVSASYVGYTSWPPFTKTQDRHRKNRAIRLLRRQVRQDWCCAWCGDDLSYDKRTDAHYCREACRKAAARRRRQRREADTLANFADDFGKI